MPQSQLLPTDVHACSDVALCALSMQYAVCNMHSWPLMAFIIIIILNRTWYLFGFTYWFRC